MVKIKYKGVLDMKCAICKMKPKNKCEKEGFDCTGGKLDLSDYQLEENQGPHRISGYLQYEHGDNLTRLEELMEYCNKMEYKKLGLAFCIGLAGESRLISEILSNHQFQVSSVCCKICGLDKQDFDVPNINSKKLEILCNPIGQAQILNRAKVDLNVEIGLCVGHDILLHQYLEAPVTVLAVKDRMLAHNPLGVVYSGYWKKKFKVK